MKSFFIFISFTEICCRGSNEQYVHVGSDNGLVLNRLQAIIWTNAGIFFFNAYVHHTTTGGRLNKKDGLTRYGNSHVKDKTS